MKQAASGLVEFHASDRYMPNLDTCIAEVDPRKRIQPITQFDRKMIDEEGHALALVVRLHPQFPNLDVIALTSY